MLKKIKNRYHQNFEKHKVKIIEYTIRVQRQYFIFNATLFLIFAWFTDYFNYLVELDTTNFMIITSFIVLLDIFGYLFFYFVVPKHKDIAIQASCIYLFAVLIAILSFNWYANDVIYYSMIYGIILSTANILLYPILYSLLVCASLFIDLIYVIYKNRLEIFSENFWYYISDDIVIVLICFAFNILICEIKFREFEYHKRLNRENELDRLTMLYNRKFAENAISIVSKEENILCSMAIIDLDNFKKINDNLGHASGDIFLREISYTLQNIFDGCLVSRLGGDEFLIFSDTNTREEFTSKTRKFMSKLPLDIPTDTMTISVSASVGITFNMSKEKNLYETMYKIADGRMYRAKNNGKNQCIME